MPAVFNIGAANAINVYSLKDGLTKQLIPDAVVTASLLTADKSASVPSSSFSLPLIDNPTAHYGGNSPVLALVEGTRYWLQLSGVKNSVVVMLKHIEVVAGYDGAV